MMNASEFRAQFRGMSVVRVLGVLVLLCLVAVLLWWWLGGGDQVSNALLDERGRADVQGSPVVPASSAAMVTPAPAATTRSVTAASTGSAALPVRPVQIHKVERSLSRDYLMHPQSTLDGYFNLALSLEEARWMVRHGYLPPSPAHEDDRFEKAYGSLDLDKLERMARGGNLQAALVGYRKAARAARAQFDAGQREAIDVMTVRATKNEMALYRQVAMQAFQNPLWQRSREFLRIAVVHGSSHAASLMSGTYQYKAGNCTKPAYCIAWELVAWRMGEWDISIGNRDGRGLALGIAIHRADAVWHSLNEDRARLGMPPLRMDLRPNRAKWIAFKSGKLEDDTLQFYRLE